MPPKRRLVVLYLASRWAPAVTHVTIVLITFLKAHKLGALLVELGLQLRVQQAGINEHGAAVGVERVLKVERFQLSDATKRKHGIVIVVGYLCGDRFALSVAFGSFAVVKRNCLTPHVLLQNSSSGQTFMKGMSWCGLSGSF
eukprot:6205576-Pleurochrysis_carterae.AAC.1